ncbi:hypothetical protein AAG570_004272 [Ranatra chinensis]|uniref:Uncharacterized protein n=1 Tax=Ranatra chinensis TaxID=642074 RepID=A0ABD0YIM3_9HEMI
MGQTLPEDAPNMGRETLEPPFVTTQPTPEDSALLSLINQPVDQLERKHEELQQLIVEHQAELRRLSEQLLMARYGLLPSILNINSKVYYEACENLKPFLMAPETVESFYDEEMFPLFDQLYTAYYAILKYLRCAISAVD